jgi:hypothetical protein
MTRSSRSRRRSSSESFLRNHIEPRAEFRNDSFVDRSRVRRACGRALRRWGSGPKMSGLMRPLMDLGELADGNDVVRRGVEDVKELGSRLFQTAKLEQGSTKGHPRRQIGGMLRESRLAHPHGFLAVACPAVLLGKLRKSNRRRVPQDPASKVFNPRVVRHP